MLSQAKMLIMFFAWIHNIQHNSPLYQPLTFLPLMPFLFSVQRHEGLLCSEAKAAAPES